MLIITDGLPRGLGYLEIDQRASEIPIANGQSYFESDTYTCSHCESVVILNLMRKRERYKCFKCNHHICDSCTAKMVTGEQCLPFKEKVEQYFEQLARQVASDSIITP